MVFLSSTHYLVSPRSCSFLAYPFYQSVVLSFKSFSSYQALLLFSTGVLPKFYFVPIPYLFHFNQSGLEFLFVPQAILQLFATFAVSWFHSFVQEATLFYLFLFPLPLLMLRSRGEISCKWGSVVTARDRSFRCLPCFRDSHVIYLLFCIASCHHAINFATQLKLI